MSTTAAGCRHDPPCPVASDVGSTSAATVVHAVEQGWSLLCNGIVLFDDGGLLLPDGSCQVRELRRVS